MKNPKFSKGLSEAIRDETQAPKMYEKLKKNAKSKTAKKVISSIIKDEKRHRRALKKLRR